MPDFCTLKGRVSPMQPCFLLQAKRLSALFLIFAGSLAGLSLPAQPAETEQLPVISIRGYQLFADSQPIHGLFVHWEPGAIPPDRTDEIRRELADIRAKGFLGVSFTVDFQLCSPSEGQFDFSQHGYSRLLQLIEEQGLWAQIKLSWTTLPDWVSSKANAASSEESYNSFLTQVQAFQAAAIRNLSASRSVLVFWLSDDYDPDSPKWLPKESDALTDFRNSLYRGARQARTRPVPLGHILDFSRILASGNPARPLASRLQADIVGCATDTVVQGALAAPLVFRKPVLIARTNFPVTPDTPEGKGAMLRMLLYQHFNGAYIQTVTNWGVFDGERNPQGIRTPEGDLRNAAQAIPVASRILSSAALAEASIMPDVLLFVPGGSLEREPPGVTAIASRMNTLVEQIKRLGMRPILIHSYDFFREEPGAPGPPPMAGTVFGGKSVALLSGFGQWDTKFLESRALESFIRNGGVLLHDYSENGPPAWTAVRAFPRLGTQFIETIPAVNHWSFQHREANTVQTLGLNPESHDVGLPTVLAVIEKQGEPVALQVALERGHVIYSGFPLFASGTITLDRGIIQDAAALVEKYPPLRIPGPLYSRVGDNILLVAFSDWQGEVDLPVEDIDLFIFTPQGELKAEEPELFSMAGGKLIFELKAGEFALIAPENQINLADEVKKNSE